MNLFLEKEGLIFPTQCAGAQNGCIGVHEARNQEFSLSAEYLENSLVVCFLDGVHDEVACLAETTKEDECLRRREGCEIGASLAKHLACELENLVGYLVALTGCDGNVE